MITDAEEQRQMDEMYGKYPPFRHPNAPLRPPYKPPTNDEVRRQLGPTGKEKTR